MPFYPLQGLSSSTNEGMAAETRRFWTCLLWVQSEFGGFTCECRSFRCVPGQTVVHYAPYLSFLPLQNRSRRTLRPDRQQRTACFRREKVAVAKAVAEAGRKTGVCPTRRLSLPGGIATIAARIASVVFDPSLISLLRNAVQIDAEPRDFYLFKVLRAHILPLTNCAFNKSGDRFITGSYDRTCKVWDTGTGSELHTLEGHKNVVYAIAFNNPYGDKIVTGSFDKTAKLWDAASGRELFTYKGHTTEIVCISFDPTGSCIATGSMDNTAKLWDAETGNAAHTLLGHTAEIVSLHFNQSGSVIVTGSFDNTVKAWDTRTGSCVRTLAGHSGEISSTQFNFGGDLVVSGALPCAAALLRCCPYSRAVSCLSHRSSRPGLLLQCHRPVTACLMPIAPA